ncbi:MAG: hypothetical protein B6226_04280, partial [Candidatus Cloacimonetes bacterium 4572_65]
MKSQAEDKINYKEIIDSFYASFIFIEVTPKDETNYSFKTINVNPAFEKDFVNLKDELLNITSDKLFNHIFGDSFNLKHLYKSAIGSSDVVSINVYSEMKAQWYKVRFHPVNENQLAITMLNIEEEYVSNESKRFNTKFQNIITKMAMDLINLPTKDINGYVNELLKTIGYSLDIERIQLFSYEANSNMLKLTNEWAHDGKGLVERKSNDIPRDLLEKIFPTHFMGETIVISDVSKLPPSLIKDKLEFLSIRSLANIPIIYKGEYLGFVELLNENKPRKWDKISIDLLEIFAKAIANTENKVRIEQELIRAKKEAEQSLKVKEEFIAHMSHVLKTPMNSILGNSELLYNSELDIDKKAVLKDILFSAQDLRGTIEDLVDYSIVSAVNFKLKEKKTNLALRLENLFSTYVKNHTSTALKLKFNLVGDIPKLVKVDFLVLRQVLKNLVNNAVKFTEDGTVTLDVNCKKRVVEQGKKEFEITFKVIDTGIGISPELQKSVFYFCNQGDASTTKEYQGAGLGLTNSAKLVEKMGAKLTLSSEEGVGTTFEFTLEFDLDTITDAVDLTEIVIPQENTSKKVILIAEDIDANYKLLSRVIKKITTKYSVERANDGAEVMEKFKQFSPALIFMDIHMPIIDGYEATCLIREIEDKAESPHIPIIAVSATNVKVGRDKSRNAGMN